MESIEFEMKPSKDDLNTLSIKLLMMSLWFRIYLVLCLLFLCTFWFLSKRYGPSWRFSIFGFISFLGLICPFAWVLGGARFYHKRFWEGTKRIFIVNTQGCGSRSELWETFIRWQAFNDVLETKKYILIRSNKYPRTRFTIYKHLLPDETVSSIKKILADVPVPKKHLL